MTASSTPHQSAQSNATSPPTDKPWRETPLIESAKLSQAAGCKIFLKLDSLQPSGSFKSRGLGHFILAHYNCAANPSALHFFSSSGGNAGLAAVHAANFVRRPCTVVVPLSTKPHMMAKLREAGAKAVIQEGKSWKEADAYMREVVMKRVEEEEGGVAVGVHPFDHPVVWEGHGSLVQEMEGQMGEMGAGVPDWIVCSAGGGGLFAGIALGLESLGGEWREKTGIVVVETRGAESLAKSIEGGELVTLDGITSMATSLGATRVCDKAFELASQGLERGKVKSCVLSDAEAAMGCVRLWDDEKILVEAACGVNTALCYGGRLEKVLGRAPRPDEKVVIEVCGGSNISIEVIEEWRRAYGHLL